MMADDLGYHDLGVQGCTDFSTPAIDSIAANGVRFTNGYVAAPVCAPSRAGFISARYQTRFGFEHNTVGGASGPGMPAGVDTAMSHFRRAGYVTGHIGKWHLGSINRPSSTMDAVGFNRSVWFPGQEKLNILARRFEWTSQGVRTSTDRPSDRYVDEAMAREAVAFISTFQSVAWCLFVGFLTPHEPLETPNSASYPHLSLSNGIRQKTYKAMSLLDLSVAKVMAGLRSAGLEEQTIVVFTSDNGAYPGYPSNPGSNPPSGWRGNAGSNAPFRGQKAYLHEGGIRVPFVMQFKGVIPAGVVEHKPVITLDILPTGLGAAGISVPAGTFDGVNLLPYLRGTTPRMPRDYLFWRYEGGRTRAVREAHGHLKLLLAKANLYSGRLVTKLFNVTADPQETIDLSQAYPAKRAELQAAWDEWNKDNVAPMWGPSEYGGPW